MPSEERVMRAREVLARQLLADQLDAGGYSCMSDELRSGRNVSVLSSDAIKLALTFAGQANEELDRFRRPNERNLSTSDPITPLPTFQPQHLLGLALHFREWCHSDLWGRPNEAELAARQVETAYTMLAFADEGSGIGELREALKCARIKLSRYRQQHGDLMIGGVAAEYDAVVVRIDAALASASPDIDRSGLAQEVE